MDSGHDRNRLSELSLYFLRLGAVGFGGPVALVEAMERDLVREKRLVSESEFREGLAFSQLSPGPMATQLAMYLGYSAGGIAGSALTAVSFLLPSFLLVVLLAWLYLASGGLPWLRPAFYGVGAAVIAVIARSAFGLLKRTLRSPLSWALAGATAVVTILSSTAGFWLFICAGLLEVALLPRAKKADPSLAALAMPILAPVCSSGLCPLFIFFAQSSVFVFGSGLAILPFLYGGLVTDNHWLSERQFMDSIAVSMITPGPVVIAVVFMGYMIAGLFGAIVAALGMFLPIYLITIGAASSFSRINGIPAIRAFVNGVTSAALGSLAASVLILGIKSVFDIPTVMIFLASLILVFRTKLPDPLVILLSGLAGVLLLGG